MGEWLFPYLIHILEGIDDVIWQARQQVYDKPGFQIVHSDQLGVWYNFSSGANKSGVKIKHNVHQEYNIHYAVQHEPSNIVLFRLEGHVVRDHDSGVESQDQYDPVPRGLECTVV